LCAANAPGTAVPRLWKLQFTVKSYSRQGSTATAFAFLPGHLRWLLSQPGGSKFHPRTGLKSGPPIGEEDGPPGSPGRPQQGFSMAEKLVAKTSEMKDGDRRIVFVGDQEIGVFRHQGQYYAYSNFCLHQGGPACEGLTIAKVEERLRPDMTSQGLYFSETQMNFVCPWHGMEYDMKTGECISDRKLKLKKFQILEKGDEVYVVA
jgi:nitrite reductase/ring-hydroxylating ferredoxin subunit